MTVLQVIILAIVQGVTEFLPISSTAHLILIPWLFDWDDQGLTFDVVLHAGTLAALLIYFARTWWEMLRDAARSFAGSDRQATAHARLLGILVLATIPAAVAGVLLESYAENLFRSPLLVSFQLILISLVMWAADRSPAQTKGAQAATLLDGVTIGLTQAIAIVPGTSRAGITIAAGLFRGLTREGAARFSFLLATPIIGGATLKKGYELWQGGIPGQATAFDYALGFVVAGLVGYGAIAFLLRYLQAKTLKIFVAYRMALGVIIITAELIRRSG